MPDESATTPTTTVSTPSGPVSAQPGTQSGPASVGPIVGGVIGGLAGVCLLAFAAIRYHKRSSEGGLEEGDHDNPEPERVMFQTTPFQLPASQGRPIEALAVSSKPRGRRDDLQPQSPPAAASSSTNVAQNNSRHHSAEEASQTRPGENTFRTIQERKWRAEVAKFRRVVLARQRERPEPPPEYQREVN